MGIVVNGDTEIGDDCIIRAGVVLGIVAPDQAGGAPRLGKRVDVGVGAVLLGPITVGDGAVIGANAVVRCDVPAGALAVGVPARIVPGRSRT
jgi:serine O-acetyltransferase